MVVVLCFLFDLIHACAPMRVGFALRLLVARGGSLPRNRGLREISTPRSTCLRAHSLNRIATLSLLDIRAPIEMPAMLFLLFDLVHAFAPMRLGFALRLLVARGGSKPRNRGLREISTSRSSCWRVHVLNRIFAPSLLDIRAPIVMPGMLFFLFDLIRACEPIVLGFVLPVLSQLVHFDLVRACVPTWVGFAHRGQVGRGFKC